MSKTLKPPSIITSESISQTPSVGLYGSIEQGLASDWQKEAEEHFKDVEGITLYNPRRDNWDSSWVQSIDNPEFNGQVTWELLTLDQVDIALFYFDPKTKSPVTLLELGRRSNSMDTIVCCPEGYWRKGNVDVVCKRYGIHQENTLKEATNEVISRLVHYYGVKRPTIIPLVQEPVPVTVEDPVAD